MLIEVEISEKEKKVLKPFVERHDAFIHGLREVIKLDHDNTKGMWNTLRKFYPSTRRTELDEGVPATITHPDDDGPWTLSYWVDENESRKEREGTTMKFDTELDEEED